MLGNLTSIFTTAKPIGVAVRDATIMVGSILTVLGILGVLTPEQVKDLSAEVDRISGQVPQLMATLGVIIAGGMSIYRTLTKASSDKAAEAAKEIDAKVPADATVVIKTPTGQPDIVVPAK